MPGDQPVFFVQFLSLARRQPPGRLGGRQSFPGSKEKIQNLKQMTSNLFFVINHHFDQKFSHGTSKIGICLNYITHLSVEFGTSRACFVIRQGQETINRKIRNLEH